jgi:pilus assembly protein Flp/PilA
MFARWWGDRRGATAIEYALIASIMALGAIAGLTLLGGSTNGLYGIVGDAFNKHIE